MNHEACRDHLVELAYGELSRRDAAEVERHVSGCEACKAERARLDATLGAMRRLEALPAPERGDAVLLAAARAAVEERRSSSFGLALRSFSLRIAAGSAFALLAVFVLVNVKRGVLPPTEEVVRPQAPAVSVPPAPRSAPPAVTEPGRPAPFAPQEGERGVAAKKSTAPDSVAGFSAPPPAAPRRESAEAAEQPPADRADRGAWEAAPRSSGGPGAEPPDRKMAKPAASSRQRASAPEALPPAAKLAAPLAEAPPPAPSTAPSAAGAAARGDQASAPAQRMRSGAGSLAAAAGGLGSTAREIERRHAAGELSEAQRRFEPCPGGDVRRTAWIDREQRVLKLVHERADGTVVEEWFDDAGRLREAIVRGRQASGPWARHVTIGEGGEEVVRGASGSGLAPEVPPPALVHRHPGTAFFSGPGCAKVP